MTRSKYKQLRLGLFEVGLRPMEVAKPGPLPQNIGLVRMFGKHTTAKRLPQTEVLRRQRDIRAYRTWLEGVNPGGREDVRMWAFFQVVEGIDIPLPEVRRLLERGVTS